MDIVTELFKTTRSNFRAEGVRGASAAAIFTSHFGMGDRLMNEKREAKRALSGAAENAQSLLHIP